MNAIISAHEQICCNGNLYTLISIYRKGACSCKSMIGYIGVYGKIVLLFNFPAIPRFAHRNYRHASTMLQKQMQIIDCSISLTFICISTIKYGLSNMTCRSEKDNLKTPSGDFGGPLRGSNLFPTFWRTKNYSTKTCFFSLSFSNRLGSVLSRQRETHHQRK